MVSGHHEDERERAVRALGVVGFLRKPFSALQLASAAVSALHDDIAVDEEKTSLGRTGKREKAR
jgi:hypothetical protein